MENETEQAIVGDSLVSGVEEGRRRRWFGLRRKAKKESNPITHCENCDQELRGHYCSNCGQPAVNYHRSFRHVVVDALDSFLNWDSKFLRSFGLLLWRPGWLTNQFIEGRRVRFVHPVRIYLIASIVFFLCARLVPIADTNSTKREDMTPEARATFDEKMAKLRKMKKEDSLFTITGDEERENQSAATATPSATAVPSTSAQEPAAPPPTPAPPPAPSISSSELEAAIGEITQEAPGEKKNNRPHVQFGRDKNRPRTPTEQWIDERIKNQLGEDGAKAKAFIQKLRNNLPTMMLVCIPLFAFILKILYLRQKRLYIEHLVYALNIHAFFYLAVILVVFISIGLDRLVPGTPQVLLTLLLSLLVFVQIFVSIRRVYRQSWFMSLFKFAFGGLVYFFILLFGVVATAFLMLVLPDWLSG
jgi:hypothetical protein